MPLYPSDSLYPSDALYPSGRVTVAPNGPVKFDGIPKLRVPLRAQNGHLGLVQQDSPENVDACVYAILSYELGSRIEDPDFGVEDPTFEELPLDTTEWIEAVNRYEPRADVQTSQQIEDMIGAILVEVGDR